MKIAKIVQYNRHNMAFLHQQHDSSLRGISWKHSISLDVVQGKLRAKLRKLDEWRTKVTGLKKLSADELHFAQQY